MFMTALRPAAACLAIVLTASLAPRTVAGGFADVLDTPSQPSPLATRTLLEAVVRVDQRLVAVGQRGHILVSLDGGTTWKQSPAPVSSDLTAVYFVDARLGWAVGHDGMVLHTEDGGDTWSVQLDGRKVNDLLVAAATRRTEAEPASEEAKKALAEAQRYKEQGADKPFLDVWFSDANVGYVVGAYNLIFRTADGGKTWDSWFDRTDNPKYFNLYAIRPAGGDVYVVGESGLAMKLDPAAQRFRALTVPYAGSLFGVTGTPNAVLAFGLRGTVLRSDDGGRTWTQVDVGLPGAVVGSTRTARATLLADIGGRIVSSEDGGRTFTKVALKQTVPLTGLAEAGDGRLAVVGPRGVAVVDVVAR
jgi:photosystem II stability/assembly factor-like uncharacterized protein